MTTETEITAWLATQQQPMLDALQAMVNTDGGSYDKAGVDAVGAIVKEFCKGHGLTIETVRGEKHGDCIRAILPHEGAARARGNHAQNIVLMGHRDTVFPKGEPERRPFTIREGRAYGPGVADMKAGLVMNMFVLAAFKKFGCAPGPMVGLFTGDEEIGSPEGRAVIEEEARGARVVFNSEPGRPTGGVVTGRKGGVFSIFEIEGKAAHSGGNFTAGISAIGELAHKIVAIHALTDLERGITLNVGLVSGGQSVNTVAPSAVGQIDLRYVNPADRDEGYVVELAIPWSEISGGAAHTPPAVGDTWRMNFFVMDKTRDGAQRAAGWSAPLTGSFHTLARFGRVTFLATATAQPTLAPVGMPSTAMQQLVPPAPTEPAPAAQAAPEAQPTP
ncbi:MAG: M20/M25/M40 family metallo-hydrolase, partial [Roseococcus sp.]